MRCDGQHKTLVVPTLQTAAAVKKSDKIAHYASHPGYGLCVRVHVKELKNYYGTLIFQNRRDLQVYELCT